MFQQLFVLTVLISVTRGGIHLAYSPPEEDTSPPSFCPGGLQPGDVWDPPNECLHCTCQTDGYICVTCPEVMMDYNAANCYLEDSENSTYPDCCEQRVVCQGDANFDNRHLTNLSNVPFK